MVCRKSCVNAFYEQPHVKFRDIKKRKLTKCFLATHIQHNMGLFHATCTSEVCLVGKTAIITGANSGIGKETARDFYARGARVILACRNMESAKEAVEDIKNNPPSRIAKSDYQKRAGVLAIYTLDLCSFRSIRDCAKRLLTQETAINILVNNAGIMMCPYELTEDGFEIQFQSNYLGHFLLTLLLLPKIKSSAPGCRIVNVSSFMNFCARVILACRNMERAKEAVEDIRNNPPSRIAKSDYQKRAGELAIYTLDLCSFRSIRDCAKRLLTQETAINILVNNAGIMMCPYALTEDGFEIQFQSNYLGHFLLTLLLLPKIKSSAPGCRIVNVSSFMNFFGTIYFDDISVTNSYFKFLTLVTLKRYAQSKTANILFTRELARRLKEAKIDGINVYSLHPGVIKTELVRHYNQTFFPGATFCFQRIMGPFIKTAEQGAQTTIYCSVDENVANETGLYYAECRPSTTWRTRSDEMAKNLWDYSCELLHLESNENLAIFLKNVAHQIAE
ncbi:retinol dehydrogenase 12-like [Odontomachus brunneus]|uniref:retinol dehydrogenase 12-like n=1 Tax=Odontomachus brunneus TaxID=486640 RepID=UPI0013F1A6E9|nr:retinol dehydrogenase 12-like [Odontomachus brunneus]